MNTLSGPRAELARLIAERREDYAGLSRLLGRNPAYIQQFIKRGVPRRLSRRQRRRAPEIVVSVGRRHSICCSILGRGH